MGEWITFFHPCFILWGSFMAGKPLPRRSKKFGVGKEIGGCVYVHRSYEQLLGPAVEHAKAALPSPFDYTVVKLNLKNNAVSFICCPDFDGQEEPEIHEIATISADGALLMRKRSTDPYIYHHKWLFVADDYPGFDVEKSKSRSRVILNLKDVNRRRIGKKSYWTAEVLPILMVRQN